MLANVIKKISLLIPLICLSLLIVNMMGGLGLAQESLEVLLIFPILISSYFNLIKANQEGSKVISYYSFCLLFMYLVVSALKFYVVAIFFFILLLEYVIESFLKNVQMDYRLPFSTTRTLLGKGWAKAGKAMSWSVFLFFLLIYFLSQYSFK